MVQVAINGRLVNLIFDDSVGIVKLHKYISNSINFSSDNILNLKGKNLKQLSYRLGVNSCIKLVTEEESITLTLHDIVARDINHYGDIDR